MSSTTVNETPREITDATLAQVVVSTLVDIEPATAALLACASRGIAHQLHEIPSSELPTSHGRLVAYPPPRREQSERTTLVLASTRIEGTRVPLEARKSRIHGQGLFATRDVAEGEALTLYR